MNKNKSNLLISNQLKTHYVFIYHIFCSNMFVFACPIIARSQYWLFVLKYPYWPPNIRIGPLISVIAPEFNFQYLRSGLKEICRSTRKDGAYNRNSIKLTRFKILK